MTKDAYEMNESEVRSRIVTLAFGGDERLYIAFYRKLQQGLPEGTGIILRGSIVTNKRHEDGTPYDSHQGVVMLFGGVVDLLGELPATLFGKWRNRNAYELAVVRRVQSEISRTNRFLDRAKLRLIPGLHGEHLRFGRVH